MPAPAFDLSSPSLSTWRPLFRWQRLESFLVLLVAAWYYGQHEGLSSQLAWVLLPDIALLAYLAGPRVGAWAYNLSHSYVGPLLLGLLWLSSWLNPSEEAMVRASVVLWVLHIAFDRTLGYGLKHRAHFRLTHLGPIGRKS